MNQAQLQEQARKIRCLTLAMIHNAGSGHPGGCLSCADLLAYLFGKKLLRPGSPDGDRFVLSKGHAAPALYAAGAQAGLVPHGELMGFRKLNAVLQGHPHVGTTPWVATSTGSLGQGFSAAIGMALGYRHQEISSRIYAILGDGEMQEGEVWEGAMCASHHGLGNLSALVDYNKMQSDDLNANIMGLEPLADKWRAFGWHVQELDGHDFDAIAAALDAAEDVSDHPSVLIAHTIKGKGVSYMEGIPTWHGSATLRDEELERALADLGSSRQEVAQWLTQ
uniref:Transketolase subunit A n=1 Tax=Candidatus Kentrum sp. DK TaxID=2126562 RepID=A0A450T6G8_9GAMM|nr:MAG: transketolase subunit A [Candidatus Kentron sp. DK]